METSHEPTHPTSGLLCDAHRAFWAAALNRGDEDQAERVLAEADGCDACKNAFASELGETPAAFGARLAAGLDLAFLHPEASSDRPYPVLQLAQVAGGPGAQCTVYLPSQQIGLGVQFRWIAEGGAPLTEAAFVAAADLEPCRERAQHVYLRLTYPQVAGTCLLRVEAASEEGLRPLGEVRASVSVAAGNERPDRRRGS